MNFESKFIKYQNKYLKQTGGDPKENLKRFKETMANSGNDQLQLIVEEVLSDKIVTDAAIAELVKTNKWAEFDAYIQSNPGVANFYRIFQQLFLLYNKKSEISRKQYQTALGIQQVRWMVDDENCKDMDTYSVISAKFFDWRDIPADEQNLIQVELYDNIKDRLYSKTITKELNGHYNGSIWYKVETTRGSGIGSWEGFGSKHDYFPITETINFSKLSCIYSPVLIFGSLSEQSLFKYIIIHKQRPYAMHFPTSKSNLCKIHGDKAMIVANWRHDLHHSRSGNCSTGFHYINDNCKTYENEDTIVEAVKNIESPLNKCIYDKTEMPIYYPGQKIDTKGNSITRVMNDTGAIFSKLPLNVIEGGNS